MAIYPEVKLNNLTIKEFNSFKKPTLSRLSEFQINLNHHNGNYSVSYDNFGVDIDNKDNKENELDIDEIYNTISEHHKRNSLPFELENNLLKDMVNGFTDLKKLKKSVNNFHKKNYEITGIDLTLDYVSEKDLENISFPAEKIIKNPNELVEKGLYHQVKLFLGSHGLFFKNQ